MATTRLGYFLCCFLFLSFTHVHQIFIFSDSTWGKLYSCSRIYLPHRCCISSCAFLPNGCVSMAPGCVYWDVSWPRPLCCRRTTTEKWKVFQPPIGVCGASFLSSHLLFLLFLHRLLLALTDVANWKGRLFCADQLRQQCLARGGCVTTCWEFSQQNNRTAVKNTNRATITQAACQRRQMNLAGRREKKGNPLNFGEESGANI